MKRWLVERIDRTRRSPWIAYRTGDLGGAQLFRTQRWALRYAQRGGVL